MYITRTIIALLSFGAARSVSNFTTMSSLPTKMKAVGLYKYLPISDPSSLIDVEVDLPTLQDRDVLVEVKAISVNPIDTKQRYFIFLYFHSLFCYYFEYLVVCFLAYPLREIGKIAVTLQKPYKKVEVEVDTKQRAPQPNVEEKPRILGWDGAGVIAAVGKGVKLHSVGTEVFFTGNLGRNGANAQYVALDEILAAPKPKRLSFEQAAAMPLTSVTAYEALHDRLLISPDKDQGKSLLIINSAGGVGCVASQLANIAGLKVIGTASRPESTNFSLEHGAQIVLNHTQDLLPQLADKGYGDGVDYILVNYDPYPYWDTLMKAIKPQGKICLIVDSSGLVDLRPSKDKSVTLVSEMMGTRIKYNTEDKSRHNEILQRVSELLDEGKLKTTLTKTLSPINAVNLKEAHRLLEGQHMVGKLVLHGF